MSKIPPSNVRYFLRPEEVRISRPGVPPKPGSSTWDPPVPYNGKSQTLEPPHNVTKLPTRTPRDPNVS